MLVSALVQLFLKCYYVLEKLHILPFRPIFRVLYKPEAWIIEAWTKMATIWHTIYMYFNSLAPGFLKNKTLHD